MTFEPAFINKNLIRSQAYINGQWVSSPKTYQITDPASLKTIAVLPDQEVSAVDEAVDAAAVAFKQFKTTSPRYRAGLLRKLYDLMMENAEDLAQLITWENGKHLNEARGEVKYAASYFEWFAEEAPRMYGHTISPANPSNRVMTRKEPIGVCGIITPWNFPAAMGCRKIAPALAAGCTVVVKPDSGTALSTLAIAYLAEQAGFPAGTVNVVLSDTQTPEFGLRLCESKKVKKISFTGSTNVGKLLMKQSSSTLKKLSFELGGNAPVIVFDDASLDHAVEQAVASKFRGLGQTCVCANRIYVQSGIYDKFAERFVKTVANFTVGHGLDPAATHGCLINERAINKVEEHVKDAVSKGAVAVLPGGRRPELGSPNFYSPTVLTGVTQDMQVANEETFGPLGALIKFETAEEVIEYANGVDHGLASYVFSENYNTILMVSEALEAGMVSCNTGLFTDCAIPFGGVKESGFGREGSLYGLDDYTTIKTITIGNLRPFV
ncbi:hypothetical protein BABINDRAFT_161546 [Babjeviella inositovora NRRL Y-12698]|uniref:Succinate-semialdehyde dehydrogenase n=1 Tax=Babjeviella inositovora NRRL Y-12698 TaxID=984486 RepID=A0A1E3QQ87_9ASCO|nr:uncharacterized protein BABINDRAFT_161546 [Babjeviella inositovora NRRL Y-12698]ODQ79869.1 hypothetical protein BABINDRAFT_161546 [Babjeviella inositovora NRRL Y-12698]